MPDRHVARPGGEGGSTPTLAARGITKRFGRVLALDDVDLALHAGRVHAIVGENGAGKSTLTGILGGVHRPDAGELAVHGRPVTFTTPAEALVAGVAVVYQELSLLPAMSVADNVLLGSQPRRGPLIDRRAQRRRCAELLARVGGQAIDPWGLVGDLPVARQQLVEVAKVLAADPAVVLFDEPTAVLPTEETQALFTLIRDLAAAGVAIGYISHRLDEVRTLADDVTVLRDGRLVRSTPMADTTVEGIVADMVGREVADAFPDRHGHPADDVLLDVRGVPLPGSGPDGTTFQIHRGEVLGVAGLVGSGRSRLARYLIGLEGDPGGEVMFDGRPYRPRSPRRAIEAGIVLVPEDRKAQGVVLQLPIAHNLVLPSLDDVAEAGLVRRAREATMVDRAIADTAMTLDDPQDPVSSLSGGNQQKVVLGKWLLRQPKLLILDEPLRGIDVGAKAEIHRLLRRLADDGLSILLISSELPEILGVSDRVMVMRDGGIAAVLEQEPFSPDEVMAYATMDAA